jgi:hypothetical protein
MARSNNNATNGLRGRVDQFIWKSRAGTNKTYASKVPDMSRVVPSKAQKKNRMRFKQAARYAKARLKQPGMYEYYLAKVKPGQTAYIVAWKEFYHALKNGDNADAILNTLPVQQKSSAVTAASQPCYVCEACIPSFFAGRQ